MDTGPFFEEYLIKRTIIKKRKDSRIEIIASLICNRAGKNLFSLMAICHRMLK